MNSGLVPDSWRGVDLAGLGGRGGFAERISGAAAGGFIQVPASDSLWLWYQEQPRSLLPALPAPLEAS